MKDLLSELKDACKGAPSRSDIETIRRGQSTWFRGRPTRAAEGTIALALSDETRVIINDGDVRAVKKEGEYYSVEVSAEANFLLCIDKVLKATAQRGCNCGGNRPPIFQVRDGGSEGGTNLEIVEVEVCDLICGDVEVWPGIRVHVCIPANCKITKS